MEGPFGRGVAGEGSTLASLAHASDRRDGKDKRDGRVLIDDEERALASSSVDDIGALCAKHRNVCSSCKRRREAAFLFLLSRVRSASSSTLPQFAVADVLCLALACFNCLRSATLALICRRFCWSCASGIRRRPSASRRRISCQRRCQPGARRAATAARRFAACTASGPKAAATRASASSGRASASGGPER